MRTGILYRFVMWFINRDVRYRREIARARRLAREAHNRILASHFRAMVALHNAEVEILARRRRAIMESTP